MCQTYHSVLHIYGVHTSKEAVLSAPALLGNYAPEVDFKRANIYLQHSINLTDEATLASATDVIADARTLLVSFSNGICQLYSWAGKVCVMQCSLLCHLEALPHAHAAFPPCVLHPAQQEPLRGVHAR